MLAYIIAAIATAVVFSLMLGFMTRKSDIMERGLVISAGAGSVTASCFFAWIYSILLSSPALNALNSSDLFIFLVSAVLTVSLVVVMSAAALPLFSQRLPAAFPMELEGSGIEEDQTVPGKGPEEKDTPQNAVENGPDAEETESESESSDSLHIGGGQHAPEFNKIGITDVENADEDSVDEDSADEDNSNDKDSVEKYINQAFRLKENGDLEGAVGCYIRILEEKPSNDVVFRIVLDTCAVYKSLGKGDLAKYILESYVSSYSHLMSEDVRLQIEKNITNA